MPKRVWCVLTFTKVLYLLSAACLAQSGADLQYTVEDGLPSNTVYDVIQDDRGYMWFGTDAGLSRFDGYEFTNFELKDGLPDMDILKFFKDSSGNIWMYSFNGNIGYLKEDSIFSSANNNLIPSLDYSSRITQILELGGKIYISAYHGTVKIYNPKDQSVIEPPINDLLGTYICECQGKLFGVISSLTRKPPRRDNEVAIGLSLVQFNPNPTNETDFYKELMLDSQRFLRRGLGYLICIDELLISHSNTIDANSLKVLNTNDLTSYFSSQVPEPGIRILSVRSLNGRVFVHTTIGLYEYFPESDQFLLRHMQEDNTANFIDHEGNTWLTSLKDGVLFKPVNKVKNSGLTIPEIDQMTVDGDQILLVGQQNRLILLNSKLEKEKEIILKGRAGFKYLQPYHHLVILGSNSNFILLDPKTGEIIRQIDMNVRAAYVRDSTLYIASSRSRITQLNLTTGEEQVYIWKNGRINDLLVRKDSILLATDRGFFIVDKQFNLTKTLVEGVRVAQILADEDQLWLPTTGKGLLKLKNGEITNYSLDIGIKQTIAEQALLNDDVLWVASNKELFKIDLKNNSFKIIDNSDGLASTKNRDMALFAGKVLIAQDDNIKYIDLNTVFNEPENFPLIIDGIKGTDGRNYENKHDEIPHNVGTLQLTFKALLFRNQSNVTYRYRLYEYLANPPQWSVSRVKTVNYSELDPGRYTFEVSAKTKNSQWSHLKTLSFTIIPAYWQTLWFKILCGVFILLIGCLIFYWSTRNNRLKRKLEKDRVMAEITALKAQINPHFLFNALNSIQSFLLSNEQELAEEYLVKYSKLMRRILDQSSLLTIPLKEEFETIQLYVDLEKYRSSNSFKFKIHIDDSIESTERIPSMILQPFVENAIWHGVSQTTEGLIQLTVKKNEDHSILLEVSDNGRGFDPEKVKTSSKGSQLVQDRLGLLNQVEGIKSRMEVKSANNVGTKVSIWVTGHLN